MTGAYEAAEDHLRYATNIDPTYALGHVGLAGELFRMAFDEKGELSADERGALANESLMLIQKAISINPNQSLAHYQLATAMTALGRYDDATIILKGLQKEIIEKDITLSSIAKTAMQKQVAVALAMNAARKAAQ